MKFDSDTVVTTVGTLVIVVGGSVTMEPAVKQKSPTIDEYLRNGNELSETFTDIYEEK